MAVDQLDRSIVSTRRTSAGARAGRSLGRVGRGAPVRVRRILSAAVGLVERILGTLPGLLRAVVRLAGRILSWVLATVLLVLHRTIALVRRAPAQVATVSAAVEPQPSSAVEPQPSPTAASDHHAAETGLPAAEAELQEAAH
jgi:hypothetical protein